MPKFIECEQGSDVWLKARIGRITASRLADVLSTRKDGKEAAPRANYRQELVAERLTGMSTDHFVSKAHGLGLCKTKGYGLRCL